MTADDDVLDAIRPDGAGTVTTHPQEPSRNGSLASGVARRWAVYSRSPAARSGTSIRRFPPNPRGAQMLMDVG
ncbi:hypothetical protein GCM10010308_68100 [Streptomyces vinaceusdrappus]|nr:hypothetical protein GCM10010301_67470 [Streptomyces plicatus]GHC39595.1 hypothetical protein GCM10010308_68100 [Streptomyces vinaceusdrappus]